MPKLNSKILIIIAGVILVILIAITLFINSLTKSNQNSQTPTLIPTGVFEGSSSSGTVGYDPFAQELGKENIKLLTEEETDRLDQLKNRMPLDSEDFTIDYSLPLGEFFIQTKTPEGEEALRQYLATNQLTDVLANFPELFHISTIPLKQAVSEAELEFQKSKDISKKEVEDKLAEQQPGNKRKSAKQEQIERDRRMLKSFSEFAGSLFTFSTGGSSSLSDIIESAITPTQTPTDTGGDVVDLGGPISATAQELLNNKNVNLSTNARMDLKNGIVDECLVSFLATVAQDYNFSVGGFKTGHSKYIAGSCDDGVCNVSNHYYGRAADVGVVNGKAVNDNNRDAYDITKWSTTIKAPIKPTEFGSPWAEFENFPGHFNNDAHENHLHVGFYDDCPRTN